MSINAGADNDVEWRAHGAPPPRRQSLSNAVSHEMYKIRRGSSVVSVASLVRIAINYEKPPRLFGVLVHEVKTSLQMVPLSLVTVVLCVAIAHSVVIVRSGSGCSPWDTVFFAALTRIAFEILIMVLKGSRAGWSYLRRKPVMIIIESAVFAGLCLLASANDQPLPALTWVWVPPTALLVHMAVVDIIFPATSGPLAGAKGALAKAAYAARGLVTNLPPTLVSSVMMFLPAVYVISVIEIPEDDVGLMFVVMGLGYPLAQQFTHTIVTHQIDIQFQHMTREHVVGEQSPYVFVASAGFMIKIIFALPGFLALWKISDSKNFAMAAISSMVVEVVAGGGVMVWHRRGVKKLFKSKATLTISTVQSRATMTMKSMKMKKVDRLKSTTSVAPLSGISSSATATVAPSDFEATGSVDSPAAAQRDEIADLFEAYEIAAAADDDDIRDAKLLATRIMAEEMGEKLAMFTSCLLRATVVASSSFVSTQCLTACGNVTCTEAFEISTFSSNSSSGDTAPAGWWDLGNTAKTDELLLVGTNALILIGLEFVADMAKMMVCHKFRVYPTHATMVLGTAMSATAVSTVCMITFSSYIAFMYVGGGMSV